jgi:uncharacterized SAM-binding protein YcdF (DUF218 family)
MSDRPPQPTADASSGGAPSPHSLEVRLRRRVERSIEALGEAAVRLGIDALACHAARPLLLAPDLRPRRFVVALSGGIRSTGHLNATSVARVRHAAELMRSGRAARLVVSGGPRRRGRPSAAPAMGALAVQLGVAAQHVLVEGSSSRTSENARQVAALLAPYDAREVLLVTSALHMRRAKLCFERCGLRVGPAPVPLLIVGEPPVRASVLAQALHEYLGLAYYRALGWI